MHKIIFKKHNLETISLFFLFLIISILSFYKLEESISPVKYLFGHSIYRLMDNYQLFHQDFSQFIFKTFSFHNGNTAAGWSSAVFLIPLFIFCDLLGGLNIKLIYIFTLIANLVFLILFYLWVRHYWGKTAAFFVGIFLGFSSIFQELARGGNYDSFSLLIAIVWLGHLFKDIGSEKPYYFRTLGYLTGLLWYAYSPLRALIIVAWARVFYTQHIKSYEALRKIFSRFLIVLIPGVILLLIQGRVHDYPLHYMFIDRENMIDVESGNLEKMAQVMVAQLGLFIDRMRGAQQIMDFPMQWKKHAAFINPWLVIAMIIGMLSVLKNFKKPIYQLLIWTSCAIFIIPLLTSGGGWNEPRRAIFYIIPMYVFIGIGSEQIWLMMKTWIKNRLVRIAVGLAALFVLGCIIKHEIDFTNEHILSSDRDLGVVSFSAKVKEVPDIQHLYYMENSTIYNGIRESSLLKFFIMDKGRSPYPIDSINSHHVFSEIGQGSYLVVGPTVEQKDYKDFLQRNHIQLTRVLMHPIINLPEKQDWVFIASYRNIYLQPFRLYKITPQTSR